MCDSCEVININGTNCHEYGCPDSWRDYKRECKSCGQSFNPLSKDQEVCDTGCAELYYN